MDVQLQQSELAAAITGLLPPSTFKALFRFEPTEYGATGRLITYLADGARDKAPWGSSNLFEPARKIQAAMLEHATGDWKVMLFEVDVPNGRYHAQFEYEDAGRWDDPVERAAKAASLAQAGRDNALGLVGEDRMTDAERNALERGNPGRR